VARPKDSKEQESCIEEACSTVRSNNSKIKLLIIDSTVYWFCNNTSKGDDAI
jgi:hypothetical protein